LDILGTVPHFRGLVAPMGTNSIIT